MDGEAQLPRVVRRLDSGVRAERVLHHLDGIDGPVDPTRFQEAGEAFLRCCEPLWTPVRPEVLLGLDAGGILPTVALSLASGIPYRLAWKLDLSLPEKLSFEEPEAARTNVSVYGLTSTEVIFLVDDEVTTGRTLGNLADALRKRGISVIGAGCLVEDGEGAARKYLDSCQLQLAALFKLSPRSTRVADQRI